MYVCSASKIKITPRDKAMSLTERTKAGGSVQRKTVYGVLCCAVLYYSHCGGISCQTLAASQRWLQWPDGVYASLPNLSRYLPLLILRQSNLWNGATP